MKHLCDGKIYSINSSAKHVGKACKGIIGLNVLPGCDTMSYPFKKGEINSLHNFSAVSLIGLGILSKDPTSKTDLMKLGKTFFLLWYCGKTAAKESLRQYVVRTH